MNQYQRGKLITKTNKSFFYKMQLFTYRIGQAQTIEGAKLTSTNTDGLYSVLESERNNEILARESESIHVEIEPEPIYLISKDSNNRMEVEIKKTEPLTDLGEITGASGGTLSCRKGPTPDKALAHPAIIDWALAEYLILAAANYTSKETHTSVSMSAPFDEAIGRNILSSARTLFNDDIHTLLMFQNVIASSPGSQRFIFATSDEDPDTAIPLQHYNRCFITKDKTPGAFHLKAAVAKVITDATAKKRKSSKLPPKQNDPVAADILSINGVKVTSLPANKEATVNKITGVEETWYMYVCNKDLYYMTKEEIDAILDNLDYDKYLGLLKDSFENNWRNITPEWLRKTAEDTAKIIEEENAPNQLFSESELNSSDNTVSADETVTTEPTPAVDTEPVISDEDASNHIPTSMFPKMYTLNRTVITDTDIKNGERQLNLGGVRIGAEHEVLVKVIKIMTGTDID